MAVRKAWFLFNLKPGKTVEDYCRWSREVNHPTANSLRSIRVFRDHKTVETLDGSPAAYQLIEEIEIAPGQDFNDYRRDLDGLAPTGFPDEWGSWVSDWICILTEENV